MLTTIECEDKVIFCLLAAQVNADGVNVVRKDTRPQGSTKDVTVATLSLTDGYTQLAVVNVTIYAKDQQLTGANSVGYQPNYTVIDTLELKIKNALGGEKGIYWADNDEINKRNGSLYIESFSPVYPVKETQEHFKTIRVAMRIVNIVAD